MPQDSLSLRSVVYRSFVTCDDPKGVVECSTIRRSKSKGRDKDHRTKGSCSTSTSLDEDRTDSVPTQSTEELQSLSSYQISEVSRGAQILNAAIDSWSSNTESFEDHPNFIANDLLKGALHLQESLVMLGKLQEASQLVAKPKKKHEERIGCAGAGLMDSSNRFGDGDTNQAVPGISSKDCYDELREVIRESFARQNLLHKVSAHEKDCINRRSLDLGTDFSSSTSSSHSSMIPGRPSHCSQPEPPKAPNLIAKLMGLEEVPRKDKQFPKGKLPNQRSYLVDIDLARPKKPQLVVQKAMRVRERTLEEMIETMQFKGLLGRNIDEFDHAKEFSDACPLRKYSVLEDPPIVIMKPRQVPDLSFRPKEFHANEESRQIPRKRVEQFPPGAFDVLRPQFKFSETNGKLPAGITPKRMIKGSEPRLSGESPARLVKKTLDSQNSLSSMKNHHKTSPAKVKKKEVVKKINTETKANSNKRKQDKTQEAPKTQDLRKTTTLKLGFARGSNVAKVPVARGEKTVAALEKNMKSKSPKANILKNFQKSKPSGKASSTLVESMQSDDNFLANIRSQVSESLSSATSEKSMEEVTSVSCGALPDISEDVSSSCDSSGATSKDDVKHIENGSPILHPGADEIKVSNNAKNTRCLLISSKSFLNHAKELFNAGPCEPTVLPTSLLRDGEMLDASILLKCAEEILERKSQHPTTHTLSQNLIQPKCYSSLEKLLGEICDEIDELRNYSKSTGDLISERIFSMLRIDLSTKAGVIGNWDFGWRHYFTGDQVNGVANDIEELVFGEMLDDAITQLMF